MSRLDSVGLAKQAGIDSKVTTPEFYVPVESASVSLNRELLEIEETIGTRFPTDPDYGTSFWELSIAGAVRAASFPRLLSAFLGAPTTSSPDTAAAPTARKHAFDPVPSAGTPVPHSILITRADPSPKIVDLFYGCMGQEISLSVEPNNYVRFDASLVAKELDDTQAAPTVTADLSDRFRFHEAKAYISVAGGGEVEIKIERWSITYGNGIDTDEFVLGSQRLYNMKEGNASCQLTFTTKQDLSPHYRRALKTNPEKVKIRLTATGAVIGGAVKWEFEWILHRCHYIDAPAQVSAADRLRGIEITARGAYNSADSKFVTAHVVNTTASY